MNRNFFNKKVSIRLLSLIYFALPIFTNSYASENRTVNKIVAQNVILNCDVSHAFQMFTVDENVEQWLTVVADIEPVVGGKYECFWNPEDRENNSTIGCKVTAITDNKLIAFEWRGPVQFKSFMNNIDPLTHVIVTFIPIGTETNPVTEVQLIHSGWQSSEEWEEARIFFIKAWRIALDNLKTVTETQQRICPANRLYDKQSSITN